MIESCKKICLIALLVAAVLGIGCGKRLPPQPPIERVRQRTEELSGVQRGTHVILSWPAPLRNAPNSSVQSVRRIDVYRLAEKPSAPLPLTEEEFAERSTLIGSKSYEEIKNAKDTLTYDDTLELAGEPARLRYAVRYVNEAGQSASFSNILLIEPAARIAKPPTLLVPEFAETAITIKWQPPVANIDESVPVNLLGYNLYRLDDTKPETDQIPLNPALISGTEFVDRNFKFGEIYRYVARSVSLGTGGAQVESVNSNIVPVRPVDIFKPSAPGPVTLAAAPGRLSIFFPANTEPDVAGYYIWRSTDPNLPKDKWTRLNSSLSPKTTFVDENVESGKTYYYYIVAVDLAGNPSDPSEVKFETVP